MTVTYHPESITDEHWQGEELAADGTHRYVWIWQGFNIRLIAVPLEDGEWGYDHGWCYPRDPAAVRAAVAAWNPDTQDEPTGWHKRPTVPVRRPRAGTRSRTATGRAACTAATCTRAAAPSTARKWSAPDPVRPRKRGNHDRSPVPYSRHR